MHYVLNHEGRPHARFFEEISQIPRASFHEERIADYVVEFAEKRGLSYRRDKLHNVLIRKPATPGYEDHETVMLQGHMDMIQAKTPDSTFDFEGPLEFVVKDGFLKAKETTCGSDDGVAIAYMLAILDDDELCHPELECVFTTAEEAGLNGALNFDCSDLKARKYINMDGNLEGTSLVIAAGGINSEFVRPIQWEEAPGACRMRIKLWNLTGGHCANMINQERGNALKAMGRILLCLSREIDLRVVSLNGGDMTTIANWAELAIALAPEAAPRAAEIAEQVIKAFKIEHRESDPDIRFEIVTAEGAEPAMNAQLTGDLIHLLNLLPSGLLNSSLVFPGTPISSSNLEQVVTTDPELRVRYRPRSAHPSKLQDMEYQAAMIAELCGFDYVIHQKYFGHNVPIGSPFFQVYSEVWKELTGHEVTATAAHFGNEIGTFLSKMPWLDVILLIATHYDAHTPNERLDLASFDRCYECLKRVLARV